MRGIRRVLLLFTYRPSSLSCRAAVDSVHAFGHCAYAYACSDASSFHTAHTRHAATRHVLPTTYLHIPLLQNSKPPLFSQHARYALTPATCMVLRCHHSAFHDLVSGPVACNSLPGLRPLPLEHCLACQWSLQTGWWLSGSLPFSPWAHRRRTRQHILRARTGRAAALRAGRAGRDAGGATTTFSFYCAR